MPSFGLSYTSFEYSNLVIDKKNFSPVETATIHITVKNSGNRAGKEVVELFASDVIASLTPDVKRLRGFEKVTLNPGESKTITFKLPVKNLAFVNTNNKRTLEAGEFKILVANQAGSFMVDKTIVF